MEKIIYSHNDNYCEFPITKALLAGCNMVECDVMYSWFKLRATSSWRPFPFLYVGTFEELYLKKMNLLLKFDDCFEDKKIPRPFWIYIDVKSILPFWINPLGKLLLNYQNDNIRYCISVQDHFLWQRPRRWSLNWFMKKYRDKLNIINKKTELEIMYDVQKIDVFEHTKFYDFKMKIINWFRSVLP